MASEVEIEQLTAEPDWGWTYYSGASVGQDDHVMPDDDIRDHDPSPDCWCKPADDHESNDYVWIHQSLDWREEYKMGIRKPN